MSRYASSCSISGPPFSVECMPLVSQYIGLVVAAALGPASVSLAGIAEQRRCCALYCRGCASSPRRRWPAPRCRALPRSCRWSSTSPAATPRPGLEIAVDLLRVGQLTRRADDAPVELERRGHRADAGRWSTSSVVMRGSWRYSLILRCTPRRRAAGRQRSSAGGRARRRRASGWRGAWQLRWRVCLCYARGAPDALAGELG
jgi:hypothetical protein